MTLKEKKREKIFFFFRQTNYMNAGINSACLQLKYPCPRLGKSQLQQYPVIDTRATPKTEATLNTFGQHH